MEEVATAPTPAKAVTGPMFFIGSAKNPHTQRYIQYPPPPEQAAQIIFRYDLLVHGEHTFYACSANKLEALQQAIIEACDYSFYCSVVEAATGKIVFKADAY